MEPRFNQVVRVHGVSSPGLLTCVAQSFSSVNIAVDSLRLERNRSDNSTATIEIAFNADKRSADLIRGRLSRLIDVLEIVPVTGLEEEDADEPAIMQGFGNREQAVLVS